MQQKPLANRGAIGAQCDFWLPASMSIQYQIWRKTTTKPMHRKFSGWTVIIEGSRTNCLIFNLRDKSDISPVGLTGTAELMSDEEQEKGCMCTFWHPGVFFTRTNASVVFNLVYQNMFRSERVVIASPAK